MTTLCENANDMKTEAFLNRLFYPRTAREVPKDEPPAGTVAHMVMRVLRLILRVPTTLLLVRSLILCGALQGPVLPLVMSFL